MLYICIYFFILFVRCGPCQYMVPILQEVHEKMSDKINIVKIDTEKYTSIANRYKIEALPTFIIFKDGEPCYRFVSWCTIFSPFTWIFVWSVLMKVSNNVTLWALILFFCCYSGGSVACWPANSADRECVGGPKVACGVSSQIPLSPEVYVSTHNMSFLCFRYSYYRSSIVNCCLRGFTWATQKIPLRSYLYLFGPR